MRTKWLGSINKLPVLLLVSLSLVSIEDPGWLCEVCCDHLLLVVYFGTNLGQIWDKFGTSLGQIWDILGQHVLFHAIEVAYQWLTNGLPMAFKRLTDGFPMAYLGACLNHKK